MNVYFDIDTIPAQSPKAIASLKADADKEKLTIKAPSNYKDPAKIEEYIAAKAAEIDASLEERYRKTSLDGALGQIVCIGYSIDDKPPITVYSDDWKGAEAEIIQKFYDGLKVHYDPSSNQRPVFIGHNIVSFDLRFLLQRSIILGVKPPLFIPFKAKPWDDVVFDTMTAWAGVGNRVSLAKLCDVFDLDAKGSEVGDIDGSKVWDFIQAGRIDDVATYCAGDVVRTRQIYKRINFFK